MPVDAKKAHSEILAHYRKDAAFRAQVDAAAKKIIRMKIAMGLMTK
jgi:hypothetical protein